MNEPRKKSGEHPAVKGFRKKFDSIQETTIPLIKQLNERIARNKKSSAPPERDPRREDDEAVPVDVVQLDEDKKEE